MRTASRRQTACGRPRSLSPRREWRTSLLSAVPDLSDRSRRPARAEAAAVPAPAIKPGPAPSIAEFAAGPVARREVARACVEATAIAPVGKVWRLAIPGKEAVAMPALIFRAHDDPKIAFSG